MNFIIKVIMVITKIIVTIALATWALIKLAWKAAFVKKEEIKANAPVYKEQLREEFESLDVSNRFTNVFDSWKTKLSDYVSSKEPETPKEQPALTMASKDAA